ncbi:MAG: OsmC family protein [Halofilum sp. (in: g-proteobacteria)]|nr:OsmC family protein [Halofilum sp. (in: g-proteobacteria)]
MRVNVAWRDQASFVGTTESGHRVMMDGPPDAGGRELGPRPMEMVLLGLGGCSAFDVVHILRRGRESLNGCEVAVEAERAETEPRVFTRIHMKFSLRGENLSEQKIDRAVNLSAEKYCSVVRMLASTATITHEWRIEGT